MRKALYILPVLAALGMLSAAHAQQDTQPPALSAVEFNTDTRVLKFTFNETIDASETDASKFRITNGGNSFEIDGTLVGTEDSDTVEFSINQGQANAIGNGRGYSIGDGAVKDPSGNSFTATTGGSIPLTSDTTPPVLLSAEYDQGTGVLTLRFDETIDISEVDARDFEINGQLQVNSSGFDGTAPDSDTVTLTDQGSVFASLPSAVIDIPDSADVQDLFGNKMTVENFAIVFVEPTDTSPPSFVSATLNTLTRVLTLVFDEIIDVSQLDLARITVLGLAENGNTESVNLAFQSSPYVTGDGSDSDTVAIANMSERIFAIHNITSVGTSGGIFDTHGNEIRPQNYPLQTVDTQPPAKRSAGFTTGGFKTTNVLASHAISYNVCDPARPGAVQALTFSRPHIGEIGLNVYTADSVSFGADVTGSVPASDYLTRVSPDYVYTVWTADVRQGAGKFFVTVFDRDDGRTASAVLVDTAGMGCAGTVFPHELKDTGAEFLPIGNIDQ